MYFDLAGLQVPERPRCGDRGLRLVSQDKWTVPPSIPEDVVLRPPIKSQDSTDFDTMGISSVLALSASDYFCCPNYRAQTLDLYLPCAIQLKI